MFALHPYGRILLVEDNSELRLILATALEAPNVEIVSTIHGADAFILFQDYDGKFDAIVTDNEMPVMEGLEFVRLIREIGYQGRILVMSGNMKPEKLRAFQEYDISGFLQKPFSVSALSTMLLQDS